MALHDIIDNLKNKLSLRKTMRHKRGQAFDIRTILMILAIGTIGLVVAGIVGAIGLMILSSLSTTGGFTGAAAVAINNVIEGIANLFTLAPQIGLIIGALVILLVLGGFGFLGFMAYQQYRNR